MYTSISKFVPTLERLLSLLIVFLLIAGTVIWSGTLFGRSIGGSSEQEVQPRSPQPNERQLSELGLSGFQLQMADSAAWNVRAANGSNAGKVVCTTLFAKDVTGFAGPTPLYIYITPDNTVKAVTAADNDDTPSFFDRAAQGVFSQITGKTTSDITERKIDAVSGATYSSESIIRNVKLTLSAYGQPHAEVQTTPSIGWGKSTCVLVVILFGILAARHWKRSRWIRTTILTLNVVVVGFWCGQFLSLSLLRGWIQNGTNPLLYVPTIAMLAVAVIMPFFGKSHHYCQWICPYGSLQELVWRIPLPKIAVPQRIYKVMRMTRLGLLMLLLIALWAGFGAQLLDYEPFSAFRPDQALPAVLILAALFTVLGIFVPRPWCRALCPLGSLLDLAGDGGYRRKKVPAQPASHPAQS